MKANRIQLLIALALISVVILFASVYYFVLRTSDASFKEMDSRVAAAKNLAESIYSNFETLAYPGTYSDEIAERLTTATTKYEQSVKELATSDLISHNQAVKKAYSESIFTLEEYTTTSRETIASLKSYNTIAQTCARMNNTLTNLTTVQKTSFVDDCEASIEASKNITNDIFDEQFFNEYRKLATQQAGEYRKLATAPANNQSAIASAITQTTQKIFDLHNQKITYNLPEAIKSLDAIKASIESQKNNFIR